MKKRLGKLTVLLMLLSTNSVAGIINGDFESGLTSWTIAGDVSITTDAISGLQSAFIDDASLDLSSLDTFFQLASGTFASTLDCSDVPCLSGGGFYQTVSYQAGDVLSFDWMTTLENSFELVDWVAFVVEGTLVQLGNGNSAIDNTLFNTEYTFLSSGTSLVGFVVGDGGDSCCGSTMLVDNVTITTVREPANIAVLGLGVFAIGLFRKRRLLKPV